jgi:ribosomal protein S10
MPLKKKMLNKIYVFVQSFFFSYLFKDIKFIFLKLFKNKNIIVIRNINLYLPKKIKKFSVVRSPTTSKLSKEQFEFRLFKSCLIFNLKTYLDFILFRKVFMNLVLKYSYFKFTTYSDLKYGN